MTKLRFLSFIILIGIMTMTGLLNGQTYASYPLYIYGEHADIASDNNNNLHVIWLRYGTMYYGRIVNNAVTGQQTVPDTEGWVAIPWSWPHIAVSPTGATVHVCWVGPDHRSLFHSWRNTAGVWTTETVLTATYSKFYWPVCAIDAAENLHLIYGNNPGNGNCDVYYAKKTAAGSWSSLAEISGGDAHLNTTDPDFSELEMFSDVNGGIHARWSLISTKYMRYRYCASNGSLASSVTEYVVDNSAMSIGPGDLHVEKSGVVHMAINAYNGYVNMDHSYKPIGGSWLAPTRASNGPVGSTTYEIWPTMAVPRDGTGRVFVAWAEGGSLVKMAVKDNSVWTHYNLDVAAGMTSNWIKPAMTATDSGVYGIWRTGSAYNHSWILGVIPIVRLTLTAPNGGENWVRTTSQPITWVSTGLSGTVKLLLYQNLNLIGTIAQNLAVGDGAYSWTVGNLAALVAPPGSNYKVRVQTTDNALNDESDGTFTIISEVEAITAPSTPTGPGAGERGVSYTYSTGNALSNLGHALQYKIDWNDGTDTGWLAEGVTGASHSWTATGTYNVRAMARCAAHPSVESLWSGTYAIVLSESGAAGNYNSPAQQKFLPEIIWAPATGSGTWMSEVQVTDISGGSQVSVYYNTGTGRRGPFLLWNNSGGALRSQKYSNILQTIDGLDSGAFTYYGTVGAVEFVTQDAAHGLQVMARTLNGNYSKTLPALSLHDSNTADTSRMMIIPNLTNNSTYRSTSGMFNPSADAVTVELRLRDAANNQIGSTITKTINGFGFSAFNPFDEAGVSYPAYSYGGVILQIQPVSGSGRVFCFGSSANNSTNDPAAHVAVQNGDEHDNGPGSLQILPEAIWSTATGGGTWMTAVQIVDVTGGSTVSVWFDYGGGSRRGPFVLWTGSGAGAKVNYTNILQQMGTIDSGLTYYGRVGTLEFQTQDSEHHIQVTARALNGNCSKTFPGLNLVDAETGDTRRSMLIQNYTNNSSYRSTCGFFNPSDASLTVEFTLLNGSGAQVGTPFSKSFVGFDFQAFNPFNEAGVPYPANSFDNVILRVRPTSGTGQVICFGASANNVSNDPAAHLAVQGQ